MIAKLVFKNDLRIMRKRPCIEHYEASYGIDKTRLARLVEAMLKESDNFFVPDKKCSAYLPVPARQTGQFTETGEFSFESPMQTSHKVNNIVYAKYYPSNRGAIRHAMEHTVEHTGIAFGEPCDSIASAKPCDSTSAKKTGRAIILVHHRGGNIESLDAMARIFANRGISALTMLMPYHGIRAPEGTKSGEFFTSANIKLTIDAFRQAVLEIHHATDWLYDLHPQIGIVGISLGGIVATLACAHDERLKTACICHSGADLAAITFRGLATQKIKEAFQRIDITEAEVRNYWKAIDPVNYIHKMKETCVLQLNTIQDTVFPLECQKKLYSAFKKSNVKYKLALFPFPCGHYSAGKYLLPKLYLLGHVFSFVKRNL